MRSRTDLLPLVVVALLSSAFTWGAAWLLRPGTSRAAPDAQAPVATIRTQRLELVNDAGEVRALLTVHPTGGGALYLYDAGTSAGAELSATTGTGGLVLRDATGLVRTGLNAGGQPAIFLTNDTGAMIWRAP
jgi:hypothetical protein